MQRLKVLIVDDNPDFAESLAPVLIARGYEVRTSYGGNQALAMLDAYDPDCLLLDLAMPGMSGSELAQAVRERRGEGVVLVAISGRGDLGVGSAELGHVDHWLTKPVDFDALYRIFPEQ